MRKLKLFIPIKVSLLLTVHAHLTDNAHLTNQEDIIQKAEIPHEPVIINVAKRGNSMKGELIGNVETNNVIFNDVTYVPELSRNLLSVSAIMMEKYCSQKIKCIFSRIIIC